MPELPNPLGILGSEPSAEGPGSRVMAADTLKGETVVNEQGERLGEIKHIVRRAVAVIGTGGR